MTDHADSPAPASADPLTESQLDHLYGLTPRAASADAAPTTTGERTTADAIAEAERILGETVDRWEEDADAGWLLTRITKAREALADRPKPEHCRCYQC